jgi:Protein of unknown function (DUF1460)
MRNFMRTTIVISSFGCILVAGAAMHLQAIAQNQIARPNNSSFHLAAAANPVNPLPPLRSADRQELDYILQQAKAGKLAQSSFGELVQSIAREFRGYTYEADLLDRQEPETLHISLKKFDCVLFVEAMLGLARTIGMTAPAAPHHPATSNTETIFVQNMETQRYRDGKRHDYCSRLHYFSDWIRENQRQGLVQDLGEQLGGIPLDKSLHFMSQNWQKYPRLVTNPDNRRCIQAMEQQIGFVNQRYIPTDRIRQIYPQLQAGDIIAVATREAGLDVTHTGLVYKHSDGRAGMIHAAPQVGVILSIDLQQYLERLGSDSIGILVARPLDPKSRQ